MKVDISKIQGYSEMSAEDKVKALESYEFNDSGAEIEKLKAALDKASSEAASHKRALREKQTAEEAKAAAEAEEREGIMKELEALRKDKAITAHKASYLEIGYDSEMAEANAKALHAGDFETVFANQKKFIEMQKKAAAAAAIDSQPSLTNGDPVNGASAGDQLMNDLRRYAGLPT